MIQNPHPDKKHAAEEQTLQLTVAAFLLEGAVKAIGVKADETPAETAIKSVEKLRLNFILLYFRI